ncbi:MAG: hypothetical protein ACP5VN_01135 [Acidobacteriota bacterium]
MGRWKALAAVSVLASLALPAGTLYLLTGLKPRPPKRPDPNLRVEGRAFVYRNPRLELRVEPLTPPGRADFFAQRGLQDPFAGFPPEDNYVAFRVRFENLSKEESLTFSPVATLFGNAAVLDEVRLYQTFYREKEGERMLEAVGRTLFVKTLTLPPGTFIERLLVYQYDDPYPVRTIPLVFASILVGRESLDLELPFEATFQKEKRK